MPGCFVLRPLFQFKLSFFTHNICFEKAYIQSETSNSFATLRLGFILCARLYYTLLFACCSWDDYIVKDQTGFFQTSTFQTKPHRLSINFINQPSQWAEEVITYLAAATHQVRHRLTIGSHCKAEADTMALKTSDKTNSQIQQP